MSCRVVDRRVADRRATKCRTFNSFASASSRQVVFSRCAIQACCAAAVSGAWMRRFIDAGEVPVLPQRSRVPAPSLVLRRRARRFSWAKTMTMSLVNPKQPDCHARQCVGRFRIGMRTARAKRCAARKAARVSMTETRRRVHSVTSNPCLFSDAQIYLHLSSASIHIDICCLVASVCCKNAELLARLRGRHAPGSLRRVVAGALRGAVGSVAAAARCHAGAVQYRNSAIGMQCVATVAPFSPSADVSAWRCAARASAAQGIARVRRIAAVAAG